MRPLLAALLLAAAAAPARAENGHTGAVTLTRPLGARGVALADAFSAVDGGLDSLTYNPAGVFGLTERELRADYTRGIVDDAFSSLAYAQRVGPAALAAGLAYYDAGTIDLNLSDGTQSSVKAEQDYLGILSAAFELPEGVTAGGAVKAYRFNLAQQASASGAAVDAGAQWRTPVPNLRLGAAIQNLGRDVKFEQQGDPLPRTIRAGAAYAVRLEAPSGGDASVAFDRFLFTADAISVLSEPLAAATGIEMRMPLGGVNAAALRVGYQFNSSVNGVTVGLGLREGRFVFDYALGIEKALGNAHHVSLGVRL